MILPAADRGQRCAREGGGRGEHARSRASATQNAHQDQRSGTYETSPEQNPSPPATSARTRSRTLWDLLRRMSNPSHLRRAREGSTAASISQLPADRNANVSPA